MASQTPATAAAFQVVQQVGLEWRDEGNHFIKQKHKNKLTVIYVSHFYFTSYNVHKTFQSKLVPDASFTSVPQMALECCRLVASSAERMAKNKYGFLDVDLTLLFVFAFYFLVQDHSECCTLQKEQLKVFTSMYKLLETSKTEILKCRYTRSKALPVFSWRYSGPVHRYTCSHETKYTEHCSCSLLQ